MNTTRRRAATRAELTDPSDLAALLPDWARHLRAANLSPGTIEAYLADMLDRLVPATVATHYRSIQQLCRWLVEEGEITVSPMARMRPAAC